MLEHPRAESIYGEWSCLSRTMFFSASIIIYKDGTFKYFDQGCTRKCYTEGKWINQGRFQIFTSYDKYRVEPSPLAHITYIDQTIAPVDKPKKRRPNSFHCRLQ